MLPAEVNVVCHQIGLRTPISRQSRVIKSIGIFHCRNKLILQTTVQGFVLISNFLKGLRCVLQHIESHPERCQAVTTDTGRLKVISGISSERQ